MCRCRGGFLTWSLSSRPAEAGVHPSDPDVFQARHTPGIDPHKHLDAVPGPGGASVAGTQELSRQVTVMDSRREENRRIIFPEMPLISNPCPSSRATHCTPNRRVSAPSRGWGTIAGTAPLCSL